jgi:hypothetical protein
VLPPRAQHGQEVAAGAVMGVCEQWARVQFAIGRPVGGDAAGASKGQGSPQQPGQGRGMQPLIAPREQASCRAQLAPQGLE